MRKILIFFLTIAFLLILSSDKASAESLNINPAEISLGEKVNISGEVNTGNAYRLFVGDTSGTTEFDGVIIDFNGDNCSIPSSSALFSSLSCTDGNLSGQLDVTSLAEIERTIDLTYLVTLGWPDGPLTDSFTVKASEDNPQATFTISFNKDTVDAGEDVEIKLENITVFGQYRAETAGGQSRVDKRCDGPTPKCTLELEIPSTTLGDVQINVSDKDGNRKTKVLGVTPISDAPIVTNTPLSQPCGKGESFDEEKGCIRINTAFGSIPTDSQNFTRWVLGFVLSVAGMIVLIIIIIAGYRLMTSQGDPEKLKNARDQLTAAIVGLLFIIFSLVILELITRDILGLPGFGR